MQPFDSQSLRRRVLARVLIFLEGSVSTQTPVGTIRKWIWQETQVLRSFPGLAREPFHLGGFRIDHHPRFVESGTT